MTVREPLTVEALGNIFKYTIEDVKMTLNPFGSLLLGVHDTSTPVQPLHTSLFDFFSSHVQDGAKENHYYVDTSDQGLFTLGCFKLLNGMLRFNICNLETSHRRNRDISDFDTRVKEAIPLHLSYACRFWAFHLRDSHDKKGLITEIRTLMHDKLLYLFEALSLLGEVEQGLVAMRIVNLWCKDVDCQLAKQALDAWHFAFEFGDVIMESTPHLYLSALPFTPNDSFISEQFLPLYPQLFSIEAGHSLGSVSKPGFMKKSSSEDISLLVFSPQGRYIAIAFGDGEFWFGDYETGEVVYRVNPRGFWICDIVFSPDGRLVYCCIADGSVFTWNVQTKETVDEFYQEVLGQRCHRCTISSDGCYIAFSMGDTILLYDRKIPQKLMHVDARPFPEPVFSPNGDYLAFRREDGAPCLWNTRKGKLVHSWTDCHYGSFALNDRYIAFCRSTIEVWDVRTVTKVWEVEGATGSLRFANDQSLLYFTGKTYGIWDVSTKDLVVMPSLDDHIQSIAASPDSNFVGIITGGNTIHVRQWDTATRSVSSDSSENVHVRKLWLRGQHLVQLCNDDWDDYFIQISNITTVDSTPLYLDVISSSWNPVVAVSSTDEHVYVAYVTTSELYFGDNVENGDVLDGSDADATTDSLFLCLWNNKEGTFVLDKSDADVTSLEFSTAGDRLISSNSSGVVKIWDAHSRALIGGPYTVTEQVNAVAFSETGDRFLVAYGTSYEMSFIEVRECRSGCISGGPFESVQPSPHGRRFFPSYMVTFTANETRIIYITQSGIEILDALTGKTEIFHPYHAEYEPLHQVSPNQKYAAWFSKRNVVELWDIDHAVPLQKLSSKGSMRHFAFSDDSAQIVISYSTYDGHYIDIWDIPTGKTTVRALPIYGTLRLCSESLLLSLHKDHLLLALNDVTTILKLDVHRTPLLLHEHHRNHSQFGMSPVHHDHSETRQSFATLNGSTSEYMDTLEHALTAWDKALFSSMTEINRDGWLLGPHGELLIWIPKKRRATFWRPSVIHIDAGSFTKLNFDKFVHGFRWAECKENC